MYSTLRFPDLHNSDQGKVASALSIHLYIQPRNLLSAANNCPFNKYKGEFVAKNGNEWQSTI